MEALKKIFFIIKDKIQSDKYFLFVSLIFFIFLFIYKGKFGDPVIDCGREAYMAFAMADLGKVLYKDIICIYGPLPYYINAFIVKIFGANLGTMYGIGIFLSYIFLYGIYNIAKRFFDAGFAFIYTLIVLFICVLNPSISNYIFPYSYAIVYALVFAVFHLIFLFKFIDKIKNNNTFAFRNLIFSAFFVSLCLLSKFDFIPCILPFLIIIFKYRKNFNLKYSGFTLFSFFLPFLLTFFILIFQHASLQNLIFNLKMISNMAHSPSLNYFYTVCTGYFFEFKKTFMFVPKFLFLSLIIIGTGFLGYFISKIKNTKLKVFVNLFLIIIASVILFKFELVRYIFVYLPLIVLVFFILKSFIFFIKKIKNPKLIASKKDTIVYSFILFSLLFSLKTLFGLFHELYGVFYLPFILLSFLIIASFLFKNSKIPFREFFKATGILIIFLFLIQNFLIFFTLKNTPIKTKAGTIYTEKKYADAFNYAFNFFNKNLKEGDTVLPLPEGLLFNFILKSDYKFFNTSFTPLDFDAYGENYLIQELLEYKPRYIIMLLRSYEDYGKEFLCKDFGQKFCEVVNENYSAVYDKNVSAPPLGQIIRIFERKKHNG